MLRADVGARALRPLREYQRIFSGFDAVVAREYERIAPAGGIATPTSPAPAPPRSTPICDGPVATGDRVYVKDFSGNTLIVEKRG